MPSSITFVGLETDKFGTAAWNTDGSGREPRNFGHDLPPSLGPFADYAYYYLSSRERIDPDSEGAAQAKGEFKGFKRFSTALKNNDFNPSDVTFTLGLYSLGDDIQGEDWFIDGRVETRFYQGKTFTLLLADQPLLTLDIPRFTINIDYKNVNNPNDDRIFGETSYSQDLKVSRTSSKAFQEIGQAFLSDVSTKSVRFVYDSFQPADQLDFVGNGRAGGFFDTQKIRLELGRGFNEKINGTNQDDILTGNILNDRIRGKAGDDQLIGLSGNDKLVGNSGNDQIEGGAGKDILIGGAGSDRLNGGGKQDILKGGADDDRVNGGGAADQLIGGTGNNVLIGGGGRDTFVLKRGLGQDVIYDFKKGKDTLGLSGRLKFENLEICA